MRKSVFPLERVRRWRLGQAVIEELKLQQLRDCVSRLREERQGMETERSRSAREVLGRPSVQAAELEILDAFRVHATTKIRDIESRERETEALAAAQLQRVMEARRDAELIERLKRKALDQWQAQSDREQDTLATELFLAKRARRR